MIVKILEVGVDKKVKVVVLEGKVSINNIALTNDEARALSAFMKRNVQNPREDE